MLTRLLLLATCLGTVLYWGIVRWESRPGIPDAEGIRIPAIHLRVSGPERSGLRPYQPVEPAHRFPWSHLPFGPGSEVLLPTVTRPDRAGGERA